MRQTPNARIDLLAQTLQPLFNVISDSTNGSKPNFRRLMGCELKTRNFFVRWASPGYETKTSQNM